MPPLGQSSQRNGGGNTGESDRTTSKYQEPGFVVASGPTTTSGVGGATTFGIIGVTNTNQDNQDYQNQQPQPQKKKKKHPFAALLHMGQSVREGGAGTDKGDSLDKDTERYGSGGGGGGYGTLARGGGGKNKWEQHHEVRK